MENENRSASKEASGLIERSLVGDTANAKVVRRGSGASRTSTEPQKPTQNGLSSNPQSSYQQPIPKQRPSLVKSKNSFTYLNRSDLFEANDSLIFIGYEDAESTRPREEPRKEAPKPAARTSAPQKIPEKASKLSNLSRMSRLSGSTPNLSAAQRNELDQNGVQRGFTCSAAERAQQLRDARGLIRKNIIFKPSFLI